MRICHRPVTHLTPESAEDLVAAMLIAAGCTLIDRNYRCPGGEIDLIVLEGHTVAFIEVKLRSRLLQARPGRPLHQPACIPACLIESMLNHRKLRALGRCAAHFLAAHPELGSLTWQFDLVLVTPSTDSRRPGIIRLREAVQLDG